MGDGKNCCLPFFPAHFNTETAVQRNSFGCCTHTLLPFFFQSRKSGKHCVHVISKEEFGHFIHEKAISMESYPYCLLWSGTVSSSRLFIPLLHSYICHIWQHLVKSFILGDALYKRCLGCVWGGAPPPHPLPLGMGGFMQYFVH